jgi:RNA polymerase sigma factor (sigma-70 family)
MRIFRNRNQPADSSDAALVLASLGGDRDAFGKIVARYQSLLCSVAYSSVGDLNHSEDIAQEAFVEAWKKLDTLREPEKLKSWLCGILRFKASHFRRKEVNQPVKNADELDEQIAHESDQDRVEDTVIRDEEQALLWQAMEKVPQTYREALILFYREQHSVKHVADELDLSEDAVKQRLSRGRKLLQEEMMAFVEGALAKSKPGAMFTMGVLAAISGIAPPAKAATLGAAAVKASSWFKWASTLAVVASISGVISTLFGLRASLDQSRTRQERRSVIRVTAIFFFLAIFYVAAVFLLWQLALRSQSLAGIYALASQLLTVAFVVSYLVLTVRLLNGMKRLRTQERLLHPEAFTDRAAQIGSTEREYRSRMTLAGVPLMHFRFGMPEEGDRPVLGWIAGGERAYGLLFAWGGIAVAPVSVGIIAIGVFGVGAIGIGLFGVGTVAIGMIGFGASAIAYKAYASLSALGWESAFSQGFAIAREGAIGSVPFAKQVNNEQAAEIVNLAALGHSYLWVLAAIAILVIVPAAWHAKAVRQRMGKDRGSV